MCLVLRGHKKTVKHLLQENYSSALVIQLESVPLKHNLNPAQSPVDEHMLSRGKFLGNEDRLEKFLSVDPVPLDTQCQ